MSKVVVGMSGGVDSATAAYLLKAEGHEVIGVTLRTWESEDGEESRCCEIDDARGVARKLDIPFHVLNCVSCFRENVVGPFVDDYLRGRTPNPCVECNRRVKWERLLYAAQVMGADFVATGHYASIVRLANGRYAVQKAAYADKDQSYMLYRLSQEQLQATRFPLGALAKEEVRSLAAQAGLPVAEKKDSQEICFVTEGSYADYIEAVRGQDVSRAGNFVDEQGNVLGTHRGIIHYTVGQRKGLGVALGYPAYVKRICAERNEVVLGEERSLYSRVLLCDDVNYMGESPLESGGTFSCRVKIRYRHTAQEAVVEQLGDGRIRVVFADEVRAATPGQAAVFYDENGCVLGGGKICEVPGDKARA